MAFPGSPIVSGRNDPLPSFLTESQCRLMVWIRIDENQHPVVQVFRDPVQGEHGRTGFAQPPKNSSVEKTRMVGQQPVQTKQFVDDMVFALPIQPGAAVNRNLFGGQPFDPASKTVTTVDAGKSAQPVTQQRPGFSLRRQPGIVVGFAIVDVESQTLALQQGVIQIPGHLPARIILKQFGIGPLHAALGQQPLGRFPRTAQSFEQKNSIRKFLPHPSRQITPHRQRHHVPGVATETVDAPATPRQKDFRQLPSQIGIFVLQFDQILPDRAPSPGTGEAAVRMPPEPFGMVFVEQGAPPRVVDHQIQDYFGLTPARFPCELAKLLHSGRPLIEFDQRGIYPRQIQRRVRAAETPEPREGGRRGIHRQQMNNPATEIVADMPQRSLEIPQGAGGGYQRITFPVPLPQAFFFFLILPDRLAASFAEQPWPSAIDQIGGPVIVRMNRNAVIVSSGPMRLSVLVHQKGFGPIESRLGKQQAEAESRNGPLHRQIAATFRPLTRRGFVYPDNFPIDRRPGTDRRPQARGAPTPAFRSSVNEQFEFQPISDETDMAFPGGRLHGEVPFHRLLLQCDPTVAPSRSASLTAAAKSLSTNLLTGNQNCRERPRRSPRTGSSRPRRDRDRGKTDCQIRTPG